MAKGHRLAHLFFHQQASRHADIAGGGAWDRSPDKGQAMTENKARKNAVRQRMEQTGERYNVARRSIETASAPGSHLIGDEETRRIAESFLAASPWLGNVTWQDIVAGPGAEYLAGFDGAFNPKVELGDGQRWSWSVTFTDPSGQQKTLSHESVLEGVCALVFGENLPGADGVRLLRVRQWFTEPVAERRKLDLGPGDSSRICQQALYGRQVFSTDDDLFGSKKLDFFEDQRAPQEDE
jgi:hypothetical protein